MQNDPAVEAAPTALETLLMIVRTLRSHDEAENTRVSVGFLRRIADEITAYQTASKGGVEVKALVWSAFNGDWHAYSEVGEYSVGRVGSRISAILRHYQDGEDVDTVIGRFDSEDEAKAAAQSDLDARIRNALAAPSVVSEDLLAEMAKHPGWCLEMGHKDRSDEDGPYGWCVYNEHGGVNDREWDLIGFGDTPAAALAHAKEDK